MLAALSTLWDLRVFTQIYVLQQAGGITRETNLLGVWAYRELDRATASTSARPSPS